MFYHIFCPCLYSYMTGLRGRECDQPWIFFVSGLYNLVELHHPHHVPRLSDF